jgi:putative transposase
LLNIRIVAQTLVQIFIHVVFSTKNRVEMITPEIEPELFAYIGGIAANNNSKLVAANGTANHIHLLMLLSKTIELSEFVGDIKRNSSRWIKSKGDDLKSFGWQDGYSAFSVGQTQVPMVKEYIADQKEKHGRQKFEDEMRTFYDKYRIEYDERYVWD